MEIKGQVAVVTGGGSGMGEETARFLAANGAKVALIDMNKDNLDRVAKDIDGFGLTADVANANEMEQAFAQIRESFGPARICVCCAGIAPAKRVVGREGDAMALEAFSKVINVNLVGTFNTLRLAAADMSQLSPMESDERGVIINTASVAAYEGQIGQAAYSASKGGVVGMTLPIARELARCGVRVMTIAPGIMGTPMLLNMPENVQESLAASVPFPKRLGYPSEFAGLVGHIVENQMLNGSVIRLDGAIRMREK